jgi:hypothetical protein
MEVARLRGSRKLLSERALRQCRYGWACLESPGCTPDADKSHRVPAPMRLSFQVLFSAITMKVSLFATSPVQGFQATEGPCPVGTE